MTYGVLLYAYENRHKIYGMEGLLGEVDNHGCDRLGKQVITCLKDMALARDLDPTIVDDIRKGRAKGGSRAQSQARSVSRGGSGSQKRSRSDLGFPVVSGAGSTKHRKTTFQPRSSGKGKEEDNSSGMGSGGKGKGRMSDVEVIELSDSDDAGIAMNVEVEELD